MVKTQCQYIRQIKCSWLKLLSSKFENINKKSKLRSMVLCLLPYKQGLLTFLGHLGSCPLFVSGVRVAYLFSFLKYALFSFLLLLRSRSCALSAQPCQYPSIVHSWLSHRFSLAQLNFIDWEGLSSSQSWGLTKFLKKINKIYWQQSLVPNNKRSLRISEG